MPATTPPSVTARVPATSGNLGPGFDVLGLAVKLYNRVQVTPATSPTQILSPLAPESRKGATDMVRQTAQKFFKKTRNTPFPIHVHLSGDIPIARGLGSSVTVRLGVAAGLNHLAGSPLSRYQLLELVTELEGHPDNAAPAIFGGFAASGMVNKQIHVASFKIPATATFVTLIPRFEISTHEARKLVPNEFTKSDTLHNLNRVALITAAFATRNLLQLKGLFTDKIHQPYRETLIPQLSKVIQAAEKAGAIGGWLSGSGSTIMCLTLEHPEQVAQSMRQQLPDSDILLLKPDNQGVTLL